MPKPETLHAHLARLQAECDRLHAERDACRIELDATIYDAQRIEPWPQAVRMQ